jgi:hypothetical protein
MELNITTNPFNLSHGDRVEWLAGNASLIFLNLNENIPILKNKINIGMGVESTINLQNSCFELMKYVGKGSKYRTALCAASIPFDILTCLTNYMPNSFNSKIYYFSRGSGYCLRTLARKMDKFCEDDSKPTNVIKHLIFGR